MGQMGSQQATSGMFIGGTKMGDIDRFIDEFHRCFKEALEKKTSWGRNEVVNLMHTATVKALLPLIKEDAARPAGSAEPPQPQRELIDKIIGGQGDEV